MGEVIGSWSLSEINVRGHTKEQHGLITRRPIPRLAPRDSFESCCF